LSFADKELDHIKEPDVDREEMTNEENYALDCGGYLVVPGVLKPDEVDALNKALDDAGRHDDLLSLPAGKRDVFRQLLVQPVMVWFLNQICGAGFRLEEHPRLIGEVGGDVTGRLHGGDEPRDMSASYHIQQNIRKAQSVSVVWALADADEGDGGLVVVPASHKANVEAPEDLMTLKDEMDVVKQPALKAGDMVIVCESTIHALKPRKGKGPQRLLRFGYANRSAIRRSGPGPGSKGDSWAKWAETDTAKAVTYAPGYRDTDPPPVVNSDGKKVWVEEDRKVIHPCYYTEDRNPDIDPKEFFFWDLNGYLVVRNVMSEEHLKLANEAVEKFSDKIVVGSELSGGSKTQAGSGRPVLGGLTDLPEPYCQPFRQMVDHAAVISRLLWMKGSGFRTRGGSLFAQVKGSSGQSLHDGNEPMSPARGYFFKNGRSFCETVTVTWHLHGAPAGMGGFACVPGSHKTQYRMPPGVRTCDEELGRVVQPAINAGDVLFFMDGGCTHGSKAWKNDFGRRAVLIKYATKNSIWGGAVDDPEERWGKDIVDDMTQQQLTVMRGPSRDGHNRNVPRLVVDDGKVEVSLDSQGDSYAAAVLTRKRDR